MPDNYIKWDPKFELGIPIIDAQHKKLIRLCDALHQVIVNAKPEEIDWRDSLKDALRESAAYVFVHFRDEEKLMQVAGYADLATHKREHETFTKKVLETVQNFSTMTIGDALNFVRFLYDWVLSHIAHTDKLYVNSVLDYYRKHKKA